MLVITTYTLVTPVRGEHGKAICSFNVTIIESYSVLLAIFDNKSKSEQRGTKMRNTALH